MDLLIPLDRTLDQPLRDQLYAGLRTAVVDGRLTLGARLPASRVLAKTLGISRFTVDDAYSRLIADGYIAGRHGSGTYVAHTAAERETMRIDEAKKAEPAPRQWSSWAKRLGPSLSPYPTPPVRYSFKQGVPALNPFPLAVWRRCQAKVGKIMSAELYGYGSLRGYEPLRTAVQGYLGRSRMLRCSLDQIVITTGAQEGLDLISRLFLDDGDRVVIEEPSYPTARRSFLAAGATLLPVPVDRDGLQVDSLGDRESTAKLLYVTPSHQFPTGGLLPLNRRRALLEWARLTETLIVEDDYDSEFRYGQRPVEALAALDSSLSGDRSVIYIGTFSKVLFPSLRLGYVVLPPDLVDRMLAAKEIADRHPPTLEQAALAEFVNGGHFERHLARMRRVYAARSSAMLTAVARHFGDRAAPHSASTTAGLHILVQFEVPYGETEMMRRASGAGVLIDPASPCYLSPPTEAGALLGYSVMNEVGIDQGIAVLAKALLN